MWVKPHPLRGPLNAHQGHQFQNPLPHRLSSHTGLVDPNGFGNLLADGHGGVQRRHGVLKHHGEEFAPQFGHLPFAVSDNIHTVDQDGPRRQTGRVGQQF